LHPGANPGLVEEGDASNKLYVTGPTRNVRVLGAELKALFGEDV